MKGIPIETLGDRIRMYIRARGRALNKAAQDQESLSKVVLHVGHIRLIVAVADPNVHLLVGA